MCEKSWVNSNSEFNNIEKCGVFCSPEKQLQKYLIINRFLKIIL
jgi:hypothetical protein